MSRLICDQRDQETSTLNSSVEQLSKSLIWVTAAMLQLSKAWHVSEQGFGHSDRTSLLTYHSSLFFPAAADY